jgi:Fe-S cluster assembly protein SufD
MKATAIDQDLFATVVGAMPDGKLSGLRKRSAAKFAKSGFPTVRDEDWKYTNLQEAAVLTNQWLQDFARNKQKPAAEPVDNAAITALRKNIDAHWLIIRNGIVAPSSADTLAALAETGVSISRLSADDSPADVSIGEPLSAFNAALLQDGLQIEVAGNNTMQKPLALCLVDDGTQTLTQVRVILNCAPGANISVIEFASSAGPAQFSNVVTEVSLAAGAKLDYVRIQERDTAHVGVNRMQAVMHEQARLTHFAIDFGNALGRNDVSVDIAGPGAEAQLYGLYLAADKQHLDNHLQVVHAIGPASSSQDYRGILNGRARCVFNGKVRVMRGADGTDAQQSNHNLLLSDRAEIDTKPELEIYADEVKCSHGATVGQLDQDALFYLRSRGLSHNAARHVLTRAFATAMLGTVPIDDCREYIVTQLEPRLDVLLADGG